MTLFSEGSSSNWKPQWKECKTNGGFLYVTQANGLLLPKGILIKPIVNELRSNPKKISHSILLGYYPEDGGVCKPKVVSIVNQDGSIIVDFFPKSTFTEKERGPFNIHVIASKDGVFTDLLIDISKHYLEPLKIDESTDIPNITTISINSNNRTLVDWKSFSGFNEKYDKSKNHTITIKQGLIKGVEGLISEAQVTDLNGFPLLGVKINKNGAVFITQNTYDVRDGQHKIIKSQVDTEFKLPILSQNKVLATWSEWQLILAGIGNRDKIYEIFQHAIRLDKGVIRTQDEKFSLN